MEFSRELGPNFVNLQVEFSREYGPNFVFLQVVLVFRLTYLAFGTQLCKFASGIQPRIGTQLCKFASGFGQEKLSFPPLAENRDPTL